MNWFISSVLFGISSIALVCSTNCSLGKDHQVNHDGEFNEEGSMNRPMISGLDSFRAAVLEHRIEIKSSAIESIKANLAIYRTVAKIASENKVNVLVFPESGLHLGLSRLAIEPVLEYIPDPHMLPKNESNPCKFPTLFASSYILKSLSCIARDNNLYLIANFGTRQHCQPATRVGNQQCPNTGYLAFNTDVVIDPEGNFIERYRKYNIFLEPYDKASSLETVYFDTKYGRFGLFTCFDILFMKPAIELVEKYNIDTAIFPTLWHDELPILSALQFQDAWSWTNKVNLLASNVHGLGMGSTGSGIYSGYNSLYASSDSQRSRLLIANVPIRKPAFDSNKASFEQTIIELEEVRVGDEPYSIMHYGLTDSDSVYVLDKMENKQTICREQVCCTIDHKINVNLQSIELSDKLVVIVRDGLREGIFNWHEQVCLVATLNSPFKPKHLPDTRFSTQSLASFERLSLEASFTTKYVYPVAAHNITSLLARTEREFKCNPSEQGKVACSIVLSSQSKNKTLSSFGMYGRVYEQDKMPIWWLKDGSR